jgi:ABC-2 type transport system permease protein
VPKLILFAAFFKKEFILFRRYLVNSLGGMLTIYIVFLLLFGGYRGFASMAGAVGGSGIENLVVGYVLWFFMLTTYQDVFHTILLEARQGTLEQLYMSVHGFGWVMGAKAAAGFVVNLIFVVVLLIAAMLTSGVTLRLDVLSLFPVLLGTLLGVLGVGFAIGGVTLILKRIESYTQMVQFLLIGLIAVPAERFVVFRLLPGSYGAVLIREIMVNGKNLLELGVGNVLVMYLIGFAHLFLGYASYKVCERKAMIQGTLGHY